MAHNDPEATKTCEDVTMAAADQGEAGEGFSSSSLIRPPSEPGTPVGFEDDIFGGDDGDRMDEDPKVPDLPRIEQVELLPARTFASMEALAAAFKTDVETLKGLIQSEEFQEIFQELKANCLDKERAAMSGLGAKRERMENLATVEIALAQGESRGMQRYSLPEKSDQETWNRVDWHARYLFRMRQRFFLRMGGILHGKGFTDATANQRIWFLAKRADAKNAPSKKGVSAGTPSKKKKPVGLYEETVFGKPRPKRDIAGKGKAEKASPVGPSSGPSAGKSSGPSAGKSAKALFKSGNLVGAEYMEAGADRLEDEHHDYAIPVLDDTFTPVAEDEERSAEMLKLERENPDVDEHDLTDPYNAYRAITRLTTAGLDARAIASMLKRNDNSPSTPPNEELRGKMGELMEEEARLIAMLDEHAAEGAITNFLTESSDAKALRMSVGSLMDNPNFQRFDYPKAYTALNLKGGPYPRLDGMSLSLWLTWWQVVGAHALYDIAMSRYARGFLLADIVGLGKTVTLLSVILHDINTQRAAVAEFSKNNHVGSVADLPERLQAKPWLILLPSSILNQWLHEVTNFFNRNVVNIHLYHGDVREKQGIAAVRRINRTLFPQDEVFNRADPRTYGRIIISSIQTFGQRHGPAALHSWRVSTGNGIKVPDSVFDRLDERWPQSLHGCFRGVIIDEAHYAKSSDSHVNIATRWLNAAIVGLATATPFPNGVTDAVGILRLLERPGTSEKVQRGDVSLKYKPGVDVYALPDHHPASILRYSGEAFTRFAITGTTPEAQGRVLEDVLAKLMIRRNYQSTCPHGDEKSRIGRSLPDCITRVVRLEFPSIGRKAYRSFSEPYMKRLVRVDEKNNIVLNARSMRALSVLGFCPLLGFCKTVMLEQAQEHKFNEKSAGPVSGGRVLLWNILKAVHDFKALRNKEGEIITDERHFKSHRDPKVRSLLFMPKADGVEYLPELPARDDTIGIIAEFVRFSPRLAAVLATIADQVILRKQKAVVWTVYPALQAIVTIILKLFGMDAASYSSALRPQDRAKLQSDFNEDEKSTMILVCTYATAGVGLNLHKKCWNVHMLEPAPSVAQEEQALGRNYRMGSTHTVVVLSYMVDATYDQKAANTAIIKHLPTLFANLDRSRLGSVFSSTADAPHSTSGEVTIQADPSELQGFHLTESGELVHINAPDLDPELLKDSIELEPESVLTHLFAIGRGAEVRVQGLSGEGLHSLAFEAPPEETVPEASRTVIDLTEQSEPPPTTKPPRKRKAKADNAATSSESSPKSKAPRTRSTRNPRGQHTQPPAKK